MGCSNSKYIDKLDEKLTSITYEKCKELNFNDKVFRCKVIKVYDGDTVHIAFDKNSNFNTNKFNQDHYRKINTKKYDNDDIDIVRTKIRLANIDCAEMKSKNDIEKNIAIQAKLRMENLVLNKIIYVHIISSDKYANRYVGKLYYDLNNLKNDISINQILIKENLAYHYDGKKKKDFDEWHKL